MENYIVNEHGICVNPDISLSFTVKGGDCEVRTAFIKDGYRYAYSLNCGTSGFSFGVSVKSKGYSNLDEAMVAAKIDITKLLNRELERELKIFNESATISTVRDLLKQLTKTAQQSLF